MEIKEAVGKELKPKKASGQHKEWHSSQLHLSRYLGRSYRQARGLTSVSDSRLVRLVLECLTLIWEWLLLGFMRLMIYTAHIVWWVYCTCTQGNLNPVKPSHNFTSKETGPTLCVDKTHSHFTTNKCPPSLSFIATRKTKLKASWIPTHTTECLY